MSKTRIVELALKFLLVKGLVILVLATCQVINPALYMPMAILELFISLTALSGLGL
jgi:hypothetical protein